MAGLPHIDKVKSHFISGEPGTTGREPFEHSSATGPGSNYTGGQGVTGAHTVGSGHTEQRGVDGLTSGSGLTAGSHAHNQTTGLGSTTGQQHGQHGLTGEHDRSHFSNDKPTRHTNENESLVEKAKSAVGVGADKASHSHGTEGSNFANNPNHPNYAAADLDNRGIVDKINDVLPGTPAKHTNPSSHSHESTAAAGAGGAFGPGHTHADKAQGLHTGRDGDRVDSLGQSSANYEGSLGSGPRTGGAAGTDRFDSPSSGAGLNRHDDGVHHDTSQRAPGQSSGGIAGVLGTSDKDFTGRERQGKGAYADTDGPFELNKSGPTGNTALTGREGNLDNNPVRDPNYQHNAHASVPATGSSATGSSATGAHGAHGHNNATATDAAKVGEATQPEHKSFIAKVKDAIM